MMTKLIHSVDFDPTVGVGLEIVDFDRSLRKQASTVFGMDYDDMKPDDRHVGIHVVALGDSDHYQFNRNGDGFPKEACVKYHDTFVKHGHVFRHHRNKDPKKSIGIIKASAYNEPMGRVELFIHADKEAAAPELERLKKEGEIPVSMACLRAGTPILTRDGFKPVERVSEGDVVLTHKGSWRRVIRTMSRVADRYCRVSFTSWGNRVLEITPNHSVYAASFDDIPRGHRKDSVEHPDKGWRRRHREELHRYLKWVPAGELTKNHYMCVPTWQNGPESVGVSRARLYGYYVAEGSLSQGTTIITCNADDVFVDEIENLAEWASVSRSPHRLSDKCVVLKCYSTAVHDELESACGRRCENKKVPESIRLGSLDEKFNFVAAWFNGDGWQDKKGMHWSIHPRNLALDLQALLASMGIRSSCDMITHKEERGAVKSKDPVEYVVTVSNESSSLFSDISKARDIATKQASCARPLFSGGYLMVPVKSVEFVDEPTEVYNFSVDGDESYTAHCLAVHNCTVKNDRCSICGALRKCAGDISECDHVANHLGEMFDDGRQVGTFNDEPRFFDISFVGRPADRIAWNLKVATDLPMDSVRNAEYEGVVPPDELACDGDAAARKLAYAIEISGLQEKYAHPSAFGRSARDRYLGVLSSVSMSSLPDGDVDRLRELPEKVAFDVLGRAGVIMDVPTFFRYATGDDYDGVVKPYMRKVSEAVPHVYKRAASGRGLAGVCNRSDFDASDSGYWSGTYSKYSDPLSRYSCSDDLGRMAVKCAGCDARRRIPVDNWDERRFNDRVVEKLAETYAAYQLSAIDAVLGEPGRDRLGVEAVVASSNMSYPEGAQVEAK